MAFSPWFFHFLILFPEGENGYRKIDEPDDLADELDLIARAVEHCERRNQHEVKEEIRVFTQRHHISQTAISKATHQAWVWIILKPKGFGILNLFFFSFFFGKIRRNDFSLINILILKLIIISRVLQNIDHKRRKSNAVFNMPFLKNEFSKI